MIRRLYLYIYFHKEGWVYKMWDNPWDDWNWSHVEFYLWNYFSPGTRIYNIT